MVNKNFLVVASFFYEPLGGECPNGGESHLQLLPVFVFTCVVKPTEHIPHGVGFILLLLGLYTEVYFGVTLDGQNTRFLRVFAFFGAQKPNAGVEFFPDFFFF